MQIPATFKKVPRWAWYVTGGLVIGTGAIRLYENRTTADAEEETTDPATDANYGGTYGSGYGSSPAGVIVPPVVTQDGGGPDPYAALDVILDWVRDVPATYEGIYGPIIGVVTAQNEHLLDIIADAGGTPNPGTTQAPGHTTTPVTVATSRQPTTASHLHKKTCRQLFPGFPQHDGARGNPSERSCFKEVCEKGKSGKRRKHRVFKNGNDVRTNEKCG